jgi:hypothetical protein
MDQFLWGCHGIAEIGNSGIDLPIDVDDDVGSYY